MIEVICSHLPALPLSSGCGTQVLPGDVATCPCMSHEPLAALCPIVVWATYHLAQGTVPSSAACLSAEWPTAQPVLRHHYLRQLTQTCTSIPLDKAQTQTHTNTECTHTHTRGLSDNLKRYEWITWITICAEMAVKSCKWWHFVPHKDTKRAWGAISYIYCCCGWFVVSSTANLLCLGSGLTLKTITPMSASFHWPDCLHFDTQRLRLPTHIKSNFHPSDLPLICVSKGWLATYEQVRRWISTELRFLAENELWKNADQNN